MPTNLFLKAIEKNKLVDFALGKGTYFIHDREYGEHWVLASWLYHIIPAIESTEQNMESIIIKMITKLVDKKTITIHTKFDFLINHIHVFYYLKKENSINTSDLISNLNLKIYAVIKEARQSYIASNSLQEIEIMDLSIKRIQKNGGLVDYKT